MSDVFGRLVTIILLVVLVFFIPVDIILGKTEKNENMYVNEVAETFLSDIIQEGAVTLETWERMKREIEHRGQRCDIELLVAKRKEVYSEEDEPDVFYSMVYGEEVEKQIYRDGVFSVKKGDLVSVTIERKASSMNNRRYSVFGMVFGNGKIEVGAVVE